MSILKKAIFIEGIALILTWIAGLAIDETIQNLIKEGSTSGFSNLYQNISSWIHTDNLITSIFVFIWVIGTLIYIFSKLR